MSSWAVPSCFSNPGTAAACFHSCPIVTTQAPLKIHTTHSQISRAGTSDPLVQSVWWWPMLCRHMRSPWDSPSHSMTTAETGFPQIWHIYWLFLHVSSVFSASKALLQSLAGTCPNICLSFPIYCENYWALLASFSFPYERKIHLLAYRRGLEPELDKEMFQEKGLGTGFSQRRGLQQLVLLSWLIKG